MKSTVSSSRTRVLVIDPNPSTRAQLVEQLIGAGYDVPEREAAGQEAEISFDVADFAIVRTVGDADDPATGEADAATTITIGWVRPPMLSNPEAIPASLIAANQEAARIFATIAPRLFGTVPRRADPETGVSSPGQKRLDGAQEEAPLPGRKTVRSYRA